MSNQGSYEWASLGWFIAVVAVLILCEGEPDIIDGWIKRANAVQCTSGPE